MKLEMTLNLAHLNTRREKAGEDDGPVAVDIKRKGEVKPENCKDLFSTDASFDKLLGELWDKNGELTTSDLGSMRLNREAQDCNIVLETEISKSALKFETGGLSKVTLKPLAGKLIEIGLRLQVHPKPEQYGTLCEWLGHDLDISVKKKQGELSLPRGKAKPEGADARQH